MCDCCLNIPRCLKGCLCPCVMFGQQATVINFDDTCCIKGCQCLICWPCLLPGYRHLIRNKHHVKTDCFGDCLTAICCPCCSLIQQEGQLGSDVMSPSRQFMV